MINLTSKEFNDFSGGITDNFIDGFQNRYEKADNLIINKNRKLRLAPGSEILGSNIFQIPTGAERVNGLVVNDSTLFHTSLTELSYTGASSNSNLRGPSNNVCFNIGAETNKTSFAIWNRHLLITNDGYPKINKAYKDDAGVQQLRTAGMPALATSPTVTKGGSASNSYIYGFAYYYTYQIGDSVFEDFGAITEVTITSAAAPNSNTVNITAIPVIANGATLNYDTANIKVKIYRTVNNGQVLFFIGEVTNGTLIYDDSASDSSISSNVTAYTTGDVVDNDEPPLAKYIHVANNICWYANVSESSIVSPNKVRQSIFNDPDSCPELFFDELEDEITGISSILENPIVFCKNSIYRLTGFFDELGKGGITHQKISDSVGCVSNNSIVQALGKLFFAGTDGFYYTDGLNLVKLTDHLNETYSTLIQEAQQKLNIYGSFDKINNKIWWAVQQDVSSPDNDSIFLLDLNYPMSDGGVFTTMGNSVSFIPTALVYYNDQIVRGHLQGYLLKHSSDITTNPKINESDIPSNWDEETIIYDYRSIVDPFGGISVRKWVPWMIIDLINESNICIQIISDNDRGKLIQNLKVLRYNNNVVWGDPTIIWGVTDCAWGISGLIEEKKRFVADGIRCNYKQIRMTNGYNVIQKSDDFGQAVLDTTLNTVTLVNTTDYDWNTNAVDYYISFETDPILAPGVYSDEFIVTDRSADVLTFHDAGNTAPASGTYNWVLKGFGKGEIFHLLSYSLQYGLISRSQKPFTSGEAGENA